MARPEVHSSDLKIEQRPQIKLPNEGKVDRAPEVIIAGEDALDHEYAEALAFAEEPVTIHLAPSNEKNPPKVVDCWVNGKGAEQLINGQWVSLGWLPIGTPVTTKRKYVEVLARAKSDNVQTQVIEEVNQDPRNVVDRTTAQRYPFSVLKDDNPKGFQWLTNMIRLAA